MQPAYGTDPVQLEFDAPERVANWRPLVHWIIGIPHYLIAGALQYASGVVWVICGFAVLFTGNVPEGLFRFQVMSYRYQLRTYSYALWMREAYPLFDFTMTEQDPRNDPMALTIERPPQITKRWLPLVNWWLFAIPHYVMLFLYGIGVLGVAIASFFIVLFTGKYPPGMRDYVVKVFRYGARVQAYVFFLREEYPKFTLS